MGTVRLSYVIFAVVLIGWGILGLVKGDFAAGWQPVPESMPARQALVYLTALICIACGASLLWQRMAALAARVFFVWMLAWLLLLRLPWMVVDFGVGTWWSASSTAMFTATAWIIYSWVADDWDNGRLRFFTGGKGVRLAQALFGVGLVPIGLAHFIYLDATAPLVPAWMQWPVFWSYFTGSTFVAAGIAMVTGVLARLAAVLVTLQIGLLTVLVWLPRIAAGNMSAFQWGELVVSIVLTACAWALADSYRGASRPGVPQTTDRS